MKKTLPLLLLSFSLSLLAAQNPGPPAHPVRTMGEWEEVQALVITWAGHEELLTEIVSHAVAECKVIIIAQDTAEVSNMLLDKGVDLEAVEIINAPYNDIWIRDYGQWTTYQNEVDSLTIIDWTYNRPSNHQDDDIPAVVAGHLGLPHYSASQAPNELIHAGGNHLQNGMHTAFSSDLILDENLNRSREAIDSILEAYMGVEEYVLLPKLPFDRIHHLDMHMRFIDEETILIGQYPEGVADGPQIEDNVRFIQTQLQTPFGNPYEIIRIPMPPDTNGLYPDLGSYYHTYTNALFLNKTILVPVYGLPYDSLAILLYQEHLPGYNIQDINCADIIPRVGAVHCITKLVGSHDPLWIAHPRLRDTYQTSGSYPVQAIIQHASGINGATLYYATGSQSEYTGLPMSPPGIDESFWTAAIPAQTAGTEVRYYIEAQAVSGKIQRRPLVAPEGYFRFQVKAAGPPTADFLSDLEETCTGQIIHFFNQSEGVVDSWSWSFPGGVPPAAAVSDPVVTYPGPGIYDVSLTVSNEHGTSSISKQGLIHVLSDGLLIPFEEDFTGGPDAAWEIGNPQKDAAKWQLAFDPNCNGECFVMDNYSFETINTNDYLRVRLDLRGVAAALLTFDLAYAQFDFLNSDGFRVSVINCRGGKTPLLQKQGADLKTAPPFNAAPFVPAGCQQWRQETIDLSAFTGEELMIELENIGGWKGNRLYIDNIRVDVVNEAIEVADSSNFTLRLFPNPAENILTIDLATRNSGEVSLQVIDQLGRRRMERRFEPLSGRVQEQLDISGLPSGMYVVVVEGESRSWRGRVMVL